MLSYVACLEEYIIAAKSFFVPQLRSLVHIHTKPQTPHLLDRRACVSDRVFLALLAGAVASREVHRAFRLRDPPTLSEAHKGAEEVRRQTHTGVMKQEKDDVTQHLDAFGITALDD
ncbi:hypothetical protein T08_11045 [Trichinella sp. T8]|nr:hypothetical protein T08_11045 [Trichinella sp. T8]